MPESALLDFASQLVKPMEWTEGKALRFAAELEKRGWMFDDPARANVKLSIAALLTAGNAAFYDVMDGEGVFWLNPVHPGSCATTHVLLWGRKALGHPGLGIIAMFDAFARYGLHRLQAFIPTYNRLACRYAEKCGMALEGVMRKALLREGTPVDVAVYALLREEIDDAFEGYGRSVDR